jgi:hypothetical protein
MRVTPEAPNEASFVKIYEKVAGHPQKVIPGVNKNAELDSTACQARTGNLLKFGWKANPLK